MRYLLLFVSLVVAACPISAMAKPEKIRCPAGTEQIGDAPPRGDSLYCQKRADSGENIKHGPYREWNSLGLLLSSGYFEEGQEHGEWVEYYGGAGTDFDWTTTRNQLKLKGVFEKGRRKGIWTAWHGNGQMSLKVAFVDGEIHGTVYEWHENGRRATEIDYVRGVREGRRLEWFDNGSSKLEANYIAGKREGIWTKWFDVGALEERGFYQNGTRVGHWKVWSWPNKLSWSGDFSAEGIAVGRWVQNRYQFGLTEMEPVSRYEGEKVNGQREGRWTITTGYGVYSAEFVRGKLNGKCETVIDGKTVLSVTYKDNVVHGEVVDFRDPKEIVTRTYNLGRETSCAPPDGCRRTYSFRPDCLPDGLPDTPNSVPDEQ